MTWNTTPQTLETWLGRERESLAALARGILRSHVDAEDCVQDASVAALHSPPTSNPGAWLRTVVRRAAYRLVRDASRRRRREAQVARPEGIASTHDTAERIEMCRCVIAAVQALKEPYRTAITLRYLDGLSPAKIASIQGIPVKSVKTRLSRALAQLRVNLDEAHGGKRSAWLPVMGVIAGMDRLVLFVLPKVAVVVAFLLAACGAAWWVLKPGSSEPVESASAGSPVSNATPTLAGTRHAPAPPAPSAPETLREGDAIPMGTFAGRVVDPEGQAVAGARVRIVWADVNPSSAESADAGHLLLRREAERVEQPFSVSDSDGYFRSDRPYGSTSYLCVDARGFAPQIVGPQPSGAFAFVRLATSGAARVRLLSASGSPVVGAEVRLARRLEGTWPGTYLVLASVRSDAAGRAHLPSFTGEVIAKIVPVEPALGTVERPMEPSEAEVLVRVPTVRTLERRIVDADTGAALVGAWVDIVYSCDRCYDQEPQSRRILANEHGIVRFPWQGGYYGVYAGAPGYEVGARAYADPIRLTRAMKVEGVVIDEAGSLVPGAAIVVVIPDTGRSGGFEEARWGRSPVPAWSDADGRFAIDLWMPYARTNLLTNGIPPDRGIRSILALHPAHAAAVVDGVRVTPGGREEVTLRFPRPASLAIEVVDREGRAIVGQRLSVERLIPRAPTWPVPSRPLGTDTVAAVRNRSLATDEAGRVLADGLPPGPHLVRVENTRAEAEVREGETTSVRVVKGAGPGIRGRAVDSMGVPRAGIRLTLAGPAERAPRSGPTAASSRTGPDGQFAFEDLPDGDYVVRVESEDGVTGTMAWAKPGEEVDLRLPAGPARLSIHVDGPPAGTAWYSLSTETGSALPHSGFSPLPKDPFETPPFLPGVGVLVVRAPGFGWRAVRFEAPDDRTNDIDVTLPRSGDVVGRVEEAVLARESITSRRVVRLMRTDGFLRSVVGAEHLNIVGFDESLMTVVDRTQRLVNAIARCRGSPDEVTVVSADGAFRFPDVPPGPYEISFGHYEWTGADEDVLSWVPRSSQRIIDVRSGNTTRVDL